MARAALAWRLALSDVLHGLRRVQRGTAAVFLPFFMFTKKKIEKREAVLLLSRPRPARMDALEKLNFRCSAAEFAVATGDDVHTARKILLELGSQVLLLLF